MEGSREGGREGGRQGGREGGREGKIPTWSILGFCDAPPVASTREEPVIWYPRFLACTNFAIIWLSRIARTSTSGGNWSTAVPLLSC